MKSCSSVFKGFQAAGAGDNNNNNHRHHQHHHEHSTPSTRLSSKSASNFNSHYGAPAGVTDTKHVANGSKQTHSSSSQYHDQPQQQHRHQRTAMTNSCSNMSNGASYTSKGNNNHVHFSSSPESIKSTSSYVSNANNNMIMNESKVGRTFLIGYLGSAILTKGKTGLGCLQQPLRELYCIFRQSNSRLIQERRLIVSLDGLTMIYNELGIEKCLHNDLSFVYDVDLLQLVCAQRKDKRLQCAFIPIGKDHDISYDNLFQKVDKHYAHLIENKPHPPIIALIMRRSTGIQVLECHVFICRSTSEAQVIVNEIKNVCAKHKQQLSQKTKIFQYKPYSSGESKAYEAAAMAAVSNGASGSPENYSTRQHYQHHHNMIQPPNMDLLRIQDKVETKTVVRNDQNQNALPPKSPFFKQSSKSGHHHHHQPNVTTEKVYETCYIDNVNDQSTGNDKIINKSTVIINGNNSGSIRGSNALATKSTSCISSQKSMAPSSTSLFSKIKSNLRDKSLSKSNTNLSMETIETQKMQDQLQQQNGKSGAKKSTFKQLKLKRNNNPSEYNRENNLPLSSTSSINFGSKVTSQVASRQMSSCSSSHLNNPAAVRSMSSISNGSSVEVKSPHAVTASYSQVKPTRQQAAPPLQSILVHNRRGSSGHKFHSEHEPDDDNEEEEREENLSVKSDSLATNSVRASISSSKEYDSSFQAKKVKLSKRLMDTAKSTLRSHSAHNFKNSLRNLVSKSETSIQNSSQTQDESYSAATASNKLARPSHSKPRKKASILDSNLLIDTAGGPPSAVETPVSLVYHHYHPTAATACCPNEQAILSGKCLSGKESVRQRMVAAAHHSASSSPSKVSIVSTNGVPSQQCNRCIQPCSVQYVHQHPGHGYPQQSQCPTKVYCCHQPKAPQQPPPPPPMSSVPTAAPTLPTPIHSHPSPSYYQPYNAVKSSTQFLKQKNQLSSPSSAVMYSANSPSSVSSKSIQNGSPSRQQASKSSRIVMDYDSDVNTNQHYYHYSLSNSSNGNQAKMMPVESEYYEEDEYGKKTVSYDDQNDKPSGGGSGRFKKRVFKYPVSDPKLFANHLVWNNEQKTAQPVMNEQCEMGQLVKNIAPVASNKCDATTNTTLRKTMSTSSTSNGCATAGYTDLNDSSSSPVKPCCCHDEESAGSSECKPSVTLRTSFSSRNNNQTSCHNHNNLNETFIKESEPERTSSSSNKSKVVGGVKVFPSLPYDYTRAAEMRRTRLNEIEQKLKEIERSNLERKQKSMTDEIIDLTNKSDSSRKVKMDLNEILYGTGGVGETAHQAATSSSSRAVPIQLNSHEEKNIQNEGVQNGIMKKLFSTRVEDKEKNYVYYYDNSDHFGGY